MAGNKILYTMEIDDQDFTTTVKNAKGEVVKLEDALGKTSSTGTKSMKSMTESTRDLTLAFNGAVTMISSLYNFTKQFTDASIAQTQATKNLTEEQIAYADELENLTGVNDTIIAQAETSLKVMGLNNEEVKTATKYTTDLVAGGLSLEDAMKKSALMVKGQYNELAELIPSIKVATTEQEKQSLATEYFAKKAELAKQGMEGVIGANKRLANELEDVKSKFGAVLNDAMLPILKAIIPIVKAIGEELPIALGIISGAMMVKAILSLTQLAATLRTVGVMGAFASGGASAITGMLGALAIAGASAWLGYTAVSKKAEKETKTLISTIEEGKLKLADLKVELAEQNSLKSLNNKITNESIEIEKNKLIQMGFTEETLKKSAEIYKKDNNFRLQAFLDTNKEYLKITEGVNVYAAAKTLRVFLDYLDLNNKKIEDDKKYLSEKTKIQNKINDLNIEVGKVSTEKYKAEDEKKAIETEKENKLLELRKKANDTGIALAKQYRDQLALIGLEGFNKQFAQEEISNQNTKDNLEKMLVEKQLSQAGYNKAIELQEELHFAKIFELNESQEQARKDLMSKRIDKIVEVLDKEQAIRDQYADADKAFQKEQIDASQKVNDEMDSLREEDKNNINEFNSWLVSETSNAWDEISDNYKKDIQNHAELLAQKKITTDEYLEWATLREKKFENDKDKMSKTALKEGVKDMAQNLQSFKQFGKEGAMVAKAGALASTAISTYEGAQKSYTSLAGIPVIGPGLGFLAAGLAVAAGVARVAQITATSTGFYNGGYTGDGNPEDEAGKVHKREYVFTDTTTSRVGIPALDAVQRGQAVIVPVNSVASRVFSGSASNVGLESSIQAFNANSQIGNEREVIVINNSDFVKVTKKIEDTKNTHSAIRNNKPTGAF